MLEQIEKIKKELKEKEVQNIYLNFVDFSGNILTKMVGVQELINNTHVSWFDGISINGRLLQDFNDKKSNDWLVILPDPFSFRVIPLPCLFLIACGGIAYSIGAFIYIFKKPNLTKDFGFHELFHIFVIMGSVFHYLAIVIFIL